MGPGIFTFSRTCSNFVSKRFERTETFGLSQFLSCFSPFQFFSLYNPLFQCFKTPEMGPGIFIFSRACFNFVSKQLKHLDLVNFLFVSVRFSFFPI